MYCQWGSAYDQQGQDLALGSCCDLQQSPECGWVMSSGCLGVFQPSSVSSFDAFSDQTEPASRQAA
jgi:hypothetical protein